MPKWCSGKPTTVTDTMYCCGVCGRVFKDGFAYSPHEEPIDQKDKEKP